MRHSNIIEKMFTSGGLIGAYMRTVDWSNTPMGAIESWSVSLVTTVTLCLCSQTPVYIWWGDEYAQIYNDAASSLIGTKHPAAIGQAGRVTWSEIWHLIEPALKQVYTDGKALITENHMLPVKRHGYVEQAYFSFSLSPVYDESGAIRGVFSILNETTSYVVNTARLKTLAEFRNSAVHDNYILIIEDSDALQTYLNHTLSRHYSIRIVTHADAIATIEQSLPSLIIVGVAQDGHLSFSTIQQLREHPRTRLIPILALSPRTDVQGTIQLAALQAGADECLSKPFSAHEILSRIDIHLELHRLRLSVVKVEQEARATVEDVIEGIAHPFYALDESWNIIYANAKTREMWDKEPDELTGKNLWEVFPDGEKTESYEKMRIAIEQQRHITYETFSEFLNLWVEVSIYPVNHGLAVYFRDISERRIAEHLRERLELIVNNFEGGFAILDENWQVVYVNNLVATFLHRVKGISRGRLLTMTAENLSPDGFQTGRLYHALKQAQTDRTSTSFDEYIEEYGLWLEYRIYPSSGDIAVFIMDVTGRKEAEQKLAGLNTLIDKERQRLTGIIASLSGLIWENLSVNETELTTLSFVSAYIQTLLGYTPDEAMSEPNFWQKVIYADDWQKFIEALGAASQGKQENVLNLRAIRKDGSLINTETRMSAILHDGNHVSGIRGVTIDVTERYRSIKMQERYAMMLRQSNEELQQFASVVSHDLQEPLRMVTGYIQLLKERYKEMLDKDTSDFFDFAIDGAARMKELINDLLTYSRIDRGVHVFEEIDLQSVLDKVLLTLSLQIEDRKATVSQDALPRIKADSGQMMQLFQNLIANGLKFQSDDNPPHIHIGAIHKDKEWEFSVRDNGIGIPQEFLEHIFVMFRRLHHRGEYAGTGVGLAICKKVVERHEGKIRVESTPGEGTVFYFTIPD